MESELSSLNFLYPATKNLGLNFQAGETNRSGKGKPERPVLRFWGIERIAPPYDEPNIVRRGTREPPMAVSTFARELDSLKR